MIRLFPKWCIIRVNALIISAESIRTPRYLADLCTGMMAPNFSGTKIVFMCNFTPASSEFLIFSVNHANPKASKKFVKHVVRFQKSLLSIMSSNCLSSIFA